MSSVLSVLPRLGACMGLIAAATAYHVPTGPACRQASSPSMMATEADAKAAWLARLDAPKWGPSVSSTVAVAPADVPMKDIAASEEEAKMRWLARLDAPTWGKATSLVSTEEEAKMRWLARLDAPTWGKASLSSTAGAEAAQMAELSERCDSGETEACDAVAKEEDAKKRWLARLDAPTWGKAAAALASVAAEAKEVQATEEEAKQRWLSRLDAPTWGPAAASAPPAVAYVSPTIAGGSADEEEAKKKWLARLDAPKWGPAAKAPGASPSPAVEAGWLPATFPTPASPVSTPSASASVVVPSLSVWGRVAATARAAQADVVSEYSQRFPPVRRR